MNKELLDSLAIDSSKELKVILGELEDKQFEFLERMETVSDESRKAELAEVLQLIDYEIADVKGQLKAINSSIILDTSESTDNVEKSKNEQYEKEEKQESISQKVEELKEKEVERKQKQAEKNAKETARIANATVPPNSGGLNSPSLATNVQTTGQQVVATNVSPELTKGLLEYKNGNYDAAFNTFKSLAEKDDPQAQYMIANMYNRGEGTSKNQERAEFWMKKAADLGEVSAQLDYAILLLSSNDGDDKKISEGIKYLEMAADKDDKQAMLKYIEVAQKQLAGRHVVDKAIMYCNKLKALTKDSYDLKRYDEVIAELDNLRKDTIKQEKRIKRTSFFTVVGSLLSLVALLYVFGGIHESLWETNQLLKFFPSASEKLLVNIEWYWELVAEIMNHNGMFGLELLVIGWMIYTAWNYGLKSKFSKAIEKICSFLKYPIFIWHFIALIMEGNSVFKALGWYIIVLLISVIVGSILGSILGKIFRTK